MLGSMRKIRSVRLARLFVASMVGLCAIAFGAAPAVHALANRPIYSDFHRGWCLDADVSTPTHNGTSVQLWQCNGQDNQAWTWYADGTIRSSWDGRCLDEDIAQRLPSGATWRVQLWNCNGQKNQKWNRLERGQIVSRNDDRALQAYNSPSNPQRKIINLAPWSNARDDQFFSCNCFVPYAP